MPSSSIVSRRVVLALAAAALLSAPPTAVVAGSDGAPSAHANNSGAEAPTEGRDAAAANPDAGLAPEVRHAAALHAAVAADPDGIVDVIVALDMPVEPRGRLGPAQAAAHAAALQGRLDLVEAGVAKRSERSRMVDRFAAVAGAVMRVDAAGLDALLSRDDVASIRLDGPLYQVNLDSTTRVIGARDVHRLGVVGASHHGRASQRQATIAVIDTGVKVFHDAFRDPWNTRRRRGVASAAACFSRSGDCPNGQQEEVGTGAGVNCRHSVDCWHGTHVAGIALGAAWQGAYVRGHAGVAPRARVISINAASDIEGDRAWIYHSDFNRALDHVVAMSTEHDIAALNLSLGSRRTWRVGRCDGAYPVTTRLLRQIRSLGIVPVAAVGNGGVAGRVAHPACVSHVVSVGATDDGDDPASFSNRGPGMDLWAPGHRVWAPVPVPSDRTAKGRASGTSMATPHVTGALALLSRCPGPDTVDDRLSLLRDTGKPIRSGGVVAPRLDVHRAVAATVPNDRFGQAIEIPSDGGEVQGSNECASGERQHGMRGHNTVWWKWTAPADGPVVVSTQSGQGRTTFDFLLQVFTGSRVAALDRVATVDTAINPVLKFWATAGVTYHLRINNGGAGCFRGCGGPVGLVNLDLHQVAQPLCQGVPATIWGTHLDDVLRGTDGPDVIHALAGDDDVRPRGGDDLVCLGAGSDRLDEQGDGDDRVYAGEGNDWVRAGAGADVLVGHGGWDNLNGGGGGDRLVGGGRGDSLSGGHGNDVLVGGDGFDVLRGEQGHDRLLGEAGADVLWGHEGDDLLDGGSGDDSCDGGDGVDEATACETVEGVP